ncbi:hypothetical protein [Ramlibacter sp.]|uniref:hypothetical protein n=1 Tax=Ramlibacter sp. TaxID=1917967 RepID=UPI002612A44A|nr:hypothetical protein [Ramlibacter sp.]MDB5956886.1 hypothetical protein [Ramlibacter sp.]
MTKLLSITLLTAFLAACSSWSGMHSSSMGNTSADLQHSTDSAAAKHDNPAAVSPGGK